MALGTRFHRFITPPRLVVGSFGSLALLGSLLLYLPLMQGSRPIGYLDCLFTAVSAVCVTGLITVDTATAWSPLGQGLILAMIQLGGLGIMTFSMALLYLAGSQPGPVGRLAFKGALGPVPAREMAQVTRKVLLYTLVLEALGGAVLFWCFSSSFPPLRALALAGFHAVSAFCNAGFSLFSNSLEDFAHQPLLNLTMIVLIFLGGIGFLVLRQLSARLARGQRLPRLSLHSRLALATSGLLIAIGASLIFVLEYGRDSLGGFWPTLFTAVTPRTAGFNTVPMAGLSGATLLVVMFLMFVGASPGSCGGGVKTTTLAALWALALSRFKGRPGVVIGRRTLPEDQVNSALAVTLGGLTVVSLATVILLALSPLGGGRGDFLTLLFEAVSAFGTVGLSLGATGQLSPAGKVVIIFLMLLGRLGPITFVYSFFSHPVSGVYRRPEERIMIG